MFWKRKKAIIRRVIFDRADDSLIAANDDCFWMAILGPADPFAQAMKVHQRRQHYIESPELFIEDRLRLVEACDVFLDLFRAICIERDEVRAVRLAPILNRHVPELMLRCPVREARPSEQQLDDVLAWYYSGGEKEIAD